MHKAYNVIWNAGKKWNKLEFYFVTLLNWPVKVTFCVMILYVDNQVLNLPI